MTSMEDPSGAPACRTVTATAGSPLARGRVVAQRRVIDAWAPHRTRGSGVGCCRHRNPRRAPYRPAHGPRQRGIRRWARCLVAATCVSCAAVLAFALPATAKGALPRPIYFWRNIPEPISSSLANNPLVIRPSSFILFEDGQWVLQNMHWTGWGSSVAHGTGTSSSSNDNPDAASGQRIITWARVTLSNPGRFQGHEVYRCFTLTVPPPAHDGPLCLARVGKLWLLAPKGVK